MNREPRPASYCREMANLCRNWACEFNKSAAQFHQFADEWMAEARQYESMQKGTPDVYAEWLEIGIDIDR